METHNPAQRCPGRDSNPYDRFPSEGFKPRDSSLLVASRPLSTAKSATVVRSRPAGYVAFLAVPGNPVHLLCTLRTHMIWFVLCAVDLSETTTAPLGLLKTPMPILGELYPPKSTSARSESVRFCRRKSVEQDAPHFYVQRSGMFT